MRRRYTRGLAAVGLACLMALGLAAVPAAEDPPQFSDWSGCENLGPTVNADWVTDVAPFITKDGLSLFFTSSGRPDGYGKHDIYVSERASKDDPWGPPRNLGPDINTEFNEQTPAFSVDGHRMFFASDREYAPNALDLYVARRHDNRDPFNWEPPENLGEGVNTSDWPETGPSYFEDEATGTVTLFFTTYRSAATKYDIYASTLQPDGVFGPAVAVPGLNTNGSEQRPSIRHDGLEIFFDRPSGVTTGELDLWVSTRPTVASPWSMPVNLGNTVNSEWAEVRPAISWDGTELYFHSFRVDPPNKSADLFRCTRDKITGRSERQ